jgi:DNA-binding beta-propeller fold protein YncE
VADRLRHDVQKFTAEGEFVLRWGGRGDGAGTFDAPGGLDVDDEGNVWVTDMRNHRIQLFTADGGFLTDWGREGGEGGAFRTPNDIEVRGDLIYVSDSDNHRIQRFRRVRAAP